MTCRPGVTSDGSSERGHQAIDPQTLVHPSLARTLVTALRAFEPRHERELRVCAACRRRDRRLSNRGSSPSTRLSLPQGPSILIPRTSARNSGVELLGRHELEERALGIRVRDHDGRVDLRAVRQHARLRRDPIGSTRRCTADAVRISTPFAHAGRGHRLRDGAHAAHHVPDESLLRLGTAAQQMEQQSEQACRDRRGRRACRRGCSTAPATSGAAIRASDRETHPGCRWRMR